VQLYDLVPNTSYVFNVQARNDVGSGNFIAVLVTTSPPRKFICCLALINFQSTAFHSNISDAMLRYFNVDICCFIVLTDAFSNFLNSTVFIRYSANNKWKCSITNESCITDVHYWYNTIHTCIYRFQRLTCNFVTYVIFM